MPQHNTKQNRRNEKHKGGPDPFRLNLLSQEMERYTSDLFRENHAVFADDPESSSQINELADRDVPVSTVLLIDRDAVNKIKREIDGWSNMTGTRLTDQNRMRWTAKTYKVFQRDGNGGSWNDMYFQYAVVSGSTGFAIHHIEQTAVNIVN